MGLGKIIEEIKELITGHDEQENQQGGVLPASQDPYGDPADNPQGQGGILPASQDPYGDPADNPQGPGGILPASQDPYGDPADQR